jgi:glycosyltransferase involved in cell wall biosynthesis
MKILLVNDYGTPTGGAELGLLNLRDVLREHGHDVRLFASRAGANQIDSCADDHCFGTTSRWRTLLQTANPWARAALGRVLREFRPDVVHVRMFLTQLSPAILSLLRDVPAVYDVVWYRPVCPLGTKLLPDGTSCRVQAGAACYRNGCLPLRDWLPLMAQMRWWRRNRDVFDAVIAKSEDLKQELLAAGVAPVEVVWDGVPQRPPRPPLTSPPLVAFAGRLVPEKGADVLLRAFMQVRTTVPDAQLLIIGGGPELEHLKSLVAELSLSGHVALMGHLPQAEMEKHLDRVWVQAVPSRWAEPFGLVAIEAMMRGTAVVATGSGGLAEIIVDGQTGHHVPPGNENALAHALIPLLQDRQRAEQMGQAGRERALAHFTTHVYAKKLLELYQRIC